VTTTHYLATRAVGRRLAQRHVRELLAIFEVAPVDAGVLARALGLRFSDYEDAVPHEAALAAGAVGIVTRNAKDFAAATIPVFSPHELLSAVLSAQP